MRRSFFAILVAAPLVAQAGMPHFVMQQGKPVEVMFTDGRVAQWQIGRRQALALPTPFTVAENTCTGKEGVQGKMLFGLVSHRLILVWKEHTDPKKVGQPVKLVFKESKEAPTTVVIDEVLISLGNKHEYQKAAAGLPAERIEADDYSWMPNGGAEAPEKLELARWDGEAMFTNPETGLMENRTIPIAMGVTFTKDRKGLVLSGIKKMLGNQFSFFFGDLWAMVLHQGEDLCQLSLKASFTDVFNQVIEYLSQELKMQPYLFGADEFSGSGMPPVFKSYYTNPGVFNEE